MIVKKTIKNLILKGLVLPPMEQANTLESSMLQNKNNNKFIEASPERFQVLHELIKLESNKAWDVEPKEGKRNIAFKPHGQACYSDKW